MITDQNISNKPCDTLVQLYTIDILKTKAKIQALNHCQSEIDNSRVEAWRDFMSKVKDNIIATKE